MSQVRHACPALSAPMETGDGLLVRFLPTGPIPLDALVGLCEAARTHGNGIVEITARGSVQVRGLTACSASLFAATVSGFDIGIGDGVPVIANALPDDPAALIDADSLAAELRRAIAEARLRLAPKVSVLVDSAGRIDLDGLFADIRLRAVATPEGPRLKLALAGDAKSATPLGLIQAADAVKAVLDLLTAIAALGPEARAADLSPTPGVTADTQPRHGGIGPHPLKYGAFALGIGLAFGQADASAPAELARFAKAAHGEWAWPAPGRRLLLGPFAQADIAALKAEAQDLRFIVDADDPRLRIAACAGAPACARGLIAARALAAEIARRVPLPGDGIAIHVSGCAKGCAQRNSAPFTVVGTEQGCGLIRDGRAHDLPSSYCRPADLAGELARIMSKARETVDA
jgi:precorrin-3B synthase